MVVVQKALYVDQASAEPLLQNKSLTSFFQPQGPDSRYSSSVPTTCFVDTILIPLPVWIVLVLIPLIVVLGIVRGRSAPPRPLSVHNSTSHGSRNKRLRTRGYTITEVIYFILLVAILALQILEIARLASAGYGVALLPFALLAPILAALFHGINTPVSRPSSSARSAPHVCCYVRSRYWLVVNIILLLGEGVMNCVKIAGLAQQPRSVRQLRVHGDYPWADQVTDLAVIIALYFIVLALEGMLWMWATRMPVREISIPGESQDTAEGHIRAKGLTKKPSEE